jgi:hypothetical protein
MVNDVQTVEEIRARFDSEWVLLGDLVADPSPHVHAGRVLFQSKDRDEVYEQMRLLGGGFCAIVYTGTFLPDMAILL